MFSVPAATTTAPASTRVTVPSRSTYSTPVASPSSITTRSTRASARSSSRPAAQASWMYVFSVDLPAFVGQPCRHEPQLMQFASVYDMHRLERRAERAEGGLDRAHALAPVGPLADAEPLLDPVVVRIEVGRAERRAARADEPARLVPLGVVLRVRAQRDLRVDRGRAADAAPAEQRRRRRRRRR